MTTEVLTALEVLRDAAENNFERHRIEVVINDLTTPPKVEVIDERRQRFNGIIFYKKKNGHYYSHTGIQRAVYNYYFGIVPSEIEIHHKDFNKNNNDISNLVALTKKEHQENHAQAHTGAFKIGNFVCRFCGKTFQAVITGNNKFCSATCRRNFKRSLDLEIRKCAFCGKKFRIDKYSDVKCCSVSCAQKLRHIDAYETKECPC